MGIGAGMGAYIKMQAQKQADFVEVVGMKLEANRQENDNQNDAVKRVSGWGAVVRRMVILIVILTAFGGLLYAAIADLPVSYMYKTEIKQHLFGLLETGGKLKTLTASGFVLPPYVSHLLSAVSGFLFGSGTAKVTSRG